MNIGPAAFIGVKSGEGCKAGDGAGHVEIVAIFVGAGSDCGIVESHCIGFSHGDVVAKLWAAGELVGRAGPGGFAAEFCVELHQLMGAAHHFGIGMVGPEAAVIGAGNAVVGPGGYGKFCAVFEEEPHEIDMGLTGVKTSINMGKADGNEAGRSHDAGGLLHQLHGKLVGPAVSHWPPQWRCGSR